MSESAGTTRIIAGIDIGSNQIRMALAETTTGEPLRILEQLQRGVRLGQDTFRRGRLSAGAIRAAVGILRDYRRLLDFYKVDYFRAVATSAVREAANTDAFLDRVVMATGLDVEVIDTSEETRLTISAVRESLDKRLTSGRKRLLVVDVGGGSTLLTVMEGTEIITSQSLPLGAVRLQELMGATYESPQRAAEMLALRISSDVAGLAHTLPLERIQACIALGGDVRIAAREVGKNVSGAPMQVVTQGALNKFVTTCRSLSAEDLTERFGLAFAEAETLTPALLVHQALLEAIDIKSMYISEASMQDGLLLNLARRAGGREDVGLNEGVIQSALSVAEKYHVDLDHAHHVEALALRLFDELKTEHGLSGRHRLLLQVAALLHETGDFVNSRSHHKHSYYLIAHAELFGLSREEHEVVALAARYHRRSAPKSSHVEYMSLPRDKRMVVSKLAAILRVADALDAAHTRQIKDFCCRREGDDLMLCVPQAIDLTLQRRTLEQKSDLFEDIFGLHVRLEEDTSLGTVPRRAGAIE
ncbi:MAG: Ppx/GppA family phosphatase [Sedimentisphaerales bacterium]|nr:Ppx/GppA family phosphatase [Sedimentisphaerales bacterium]